MRGLVITNKYAQPLVIKRLGMDRSCLADSNKKKYDKSCVHEYTLYCPLKTRRKRHFFCTRRKNFLYAYKIIFRREAKYFFSREKFHFLVIHDFSCLEIYDKPSRKTRTGTVQKEHTYN